MGGQIFAPAISALPPSVVVVCRKEPGMAVRRMPAYKTNILEKVKHE